MSQQMKPISRHIRWWERSNDCAFGTFPHVTSLTDCRTLCHVQYWSAAAYEWVCMMEYLLEAWEYSSRVRGVHSFLFRRGSIHTESKVCTLSVEAWEYIFRVQGVQLFSSGVIELIQSAKCAPFQLFLVETPVSMQE